jgi:hypothetical protein
MKRRLILNLLDFKGLGKIVAKPTGCGAYCFISESFNSKYEFMLPLQFLLNFFKNLI